MRWTLVALASCPVVANFMIQNVGYDCYPCLLPVAPSVWTASGVYVAGLSLALRDVAHEKYGAAAAFYAVVMGAGVSALISPTVALASAVAFVLCEAADTLVYTGLRTRVRRWFAVLASGFVGAVIDGLVFVWLAFGSLELGAGNVLGKIYASVALAAIWWGRSAR